MKSLWRVIHIQTETPHGDWRPEGIVELQRLVRMGDEDDKGSLGGTLTLRFSDAKVCNQFFYPGCVQMRDFEMHLVPVAETKES